MSPQEKFEELISKYGLDYVLKVANHMVLYYTGIGQDELRAFWIQVGDSERWFNHLNKKN
jgi:hypothetical protein